MVHPFITTFKNASALYGQKLAMKIPIIEKDRIIEGWRDLTYAQFYEKLDGVAKYWLSTVKLPYGSVVTLWMSGMSFSDLLHIFGVMRAGYVPHILFSKITNLDMMLDLFKQTGASALIDASTLSADSVEALSKHLNLPCYVAPDAEQISSLTAEDLDASTVILPDFDTTDIQDEDVVAIIHTSGSTSGRPKVVRLRQRWFTANANKLNIEEERSIVVPRVGSFCHAGQLLSLLMYFKEQACMVMIPWNNFSAEDTIRMYNECGLTVLIQFAPYLSDTIRYAQRIPELFSILQSFPTVFYTGAALSEADVQWCKKNKIALSTALAMTETGILMATVEDPSLFQLIPAKGCSYEMVPIQQDIPPEHIKTKSPLLELVVLSSSLDCPDASLCDPRDGHFHTKDLFEEVTPGVYKYRGRLDDIIKMGNAHICDTRYIEDQVYSLCKDLVSTCVVVGSGKPSPALLVESTISADAIDEKELIELIGHKLTSLNEGGYPHERITPDHILPLPAGKLPRTNFKCNVSRAAAEKEFKDQIDALYA